MFAEEVALLTLVSEVPSLDFGRVAVCPDWATAANLHNSLFVSHHVFSRGTTARLGPRPPHC